MIYHVTSLGDWLAQKDKGEFIPSDFYSEGFVHCCSWEQVAGVLERYFKNQIELVLLHLDEKKLSAAVKYEASTNNEKFPHIYGPINKESIAEVSTIR